MKFSVFIFKPQVSKIIHFQTSQIVGNFLSTILSKITNFGLEDEACQTACSKVNHNFLISS